MRAEKKESVERNDSSLLAVLKRVREVHFEYSNDSDFFTKLYILTLVREHHAELHNLKLIQFDYVNSIKQLDKILKLN